jgi:hypothetical protein
MYNSSQFRTISAFYGGQKNIFLKQENPFLLTAITTIAQGFKPIMNVITFYNKYILIAIIITHKI